MDEAKDPLTGETFIKKRNNQIFANRQNQVKFNNIKAQRKRDAVRNITRILNRNRDVLVDILGKENEAVRTIEFMKGAKFNFALTTHSTNQNGTKWSCVYEFAYCILEGNKIKIIKAD